MKRTQEEFAKRGVDCRFASLAPDAKRKRWAKKQPKAKIKTDHQPTLF